MVEGSVPDVSANDAQHDGHVCWVELGACNRIYLTTMGQDGSRKAFSHWHRINEKADTGHHHLAGKVGGFDVDFHEPVHSVSASRTDKEVVTVK
jgi:hypothetical protein